MFWSYYPRTYSDCRPCIVLSALLHVKHSKDIYSVITKTKINCVLNFSETTGIGATVHVKHV